MKKVVFIAGGGTGGHIYPGLAIAQALEQQDTSIEIRFVGTSQGLETKIIPSNNYPLHLIKVGRLKNINLFSKILVFLLFPIAFFQCVFLILKYKPILVFGVGGYASGPFVMTAAFLGKKTALFESNAIPGVTNRILSRFVDISFTLFDESKKFLKTKIVKNMGFPVRKNISASMRKNPHENLQKNLGKLRVLIFGGSQGARGINLTVSESIKNNAQEFSEIEFVHQTGKQDFPVYKDFYKGHLNVRCYEYLDPIMDYYDWADVVFCRAGAGTLSELAACGKAAVLIPFPFAADDHQKKNGESLVNKNAAEMIIQRDFTPEVFKKKVLEFKNNSKKIFELEKNIQKIYIPNAAQNIAKTTLELQ